MDETLIAGRYEIRDLLGRGAGGTVLSAMDRQLRRLVALKLIRRPGLAEPAVREALQRALQEAQLAGRLSHPNILAVHDAGQCPDYAWIVHELVIGETLRTTLERVGPPPLPEVVRIMGEVLAGLAAVHARGIVHRNVKPQTILLVEQPGPGLGRVRLTDFGIARLAEAGLAVHGQASPTPGSLAPEQLRGARWTTGSISGAPASCSTSSSPGPHPSRGRRSASCRRSWRRRCRIPHSAPPGCPRVSMR